MSLVKLPIKTYVPGVSASAGRAYSKTCPSVAPSTPTAAPSSSGESLAGCFITPVYGSVPPNTSYQSGYSAIGVVGYISNCFTTLSP